MTWDPDLTIKAELQPGEIVRWTGRPSFLPVLWSQAFTICFGIAFAGLPTIIIADTWIKWTNNEIEPTGGMIITAFVSLFMVVGVGITAGGLLEAFGVRRTVYAVTNRRALIIKALLTHRVLAIAPSGMNAFEWHENRNGTGSITIRREVHHDSDGKNTTTLGFIGTGDVRGAVREIERLRAGEV